MTIDKVNIPIAVGNHTKLDLSCDHATTMAFMQPKPIFYRHMIKGEHINFNCLASVRPSPLVVPLFGRMRINIRGFFVPYRLCFPQWDSFYNDVIGVNQNYASISNPVPRFANNDVVTWFTSNGGLMQKVSEGEPYDIELVYTEHDATLSALFVFTPFGRRLYNLFLCLGYRLNWNTEDDSAFNAIGLLAMARIYLDWFSNSQYLDSSAIIAVRQLLSWNDPSNPLVLNTTNLNSILNLLFYAVYDGDYFVSAFDNPVTPSNNQFTAFNWFDITDPSVNPASVSSQNTYGTPFMKQNSASQVNIGTQYIHDALKVLSNYQKRHALAGAREIDRALAQYGVVTTNMRLQRSVYVGGHSIDIECGAIMQTANTAGAGEASNLGDYAGAGFGSGSKAWDYVADEEGIFIVIGSIHPSGGYVQGLDRHNLHMNKFDWFVPEADGLGCQAIDSRELYVSRNGSFNSSPQNPVTFGFTGRYGEYKRPLSWLDGDFAYPSVMEGGSAWTLFRMFDDTNFGTAGHYSQALVKHSLDFTLGSDYDSYNRIFSYNGTDVDPFYCFFHFDVGAYAPCKPLFETYDFDEETKKITIDTNGSKLN